MARTDTLGNFLTDVADAIREKSGTSEPIQASSFDTAIANIPSGDDVGKYIDLEPVHVGSTTEPWWSYRMAISGMNDLVINLPPASMGAISYMFYGCRWSYFPKIVGDFSDTSTYSINMSNIFQGCASAKIFDLSGLVGNVSGFSNAFKNCTLAEKIDIRNLTVSTASSWTNAFAYVPANCLIIVKDDTEKTWVQAKFTSLTNVKTAEEYEAE